MFDTLNLYLRSIGHILNDAIASTSSDPLSPKSPNFSAVPAEDVTSIARGVTLAVRSIKKSDGLRAQIQLLAVLSEQRKLGTACETRALNQKITAVVVSELTYNYGLQIKCPRVSNKYIESEAGVSRLLYRSQVRKELGPQVNVGSKMSLEQTVQLRGPGIRSAHKLQ